jgi:hypothetical protein
MGIQKQNLALCFLPLKGTFNKPDVESCRKEIKTFHQLRISMLNHKNTNRLARFYMCTYIKIQIWKLFKKYFKHLFSQVHTMTMHIKL